MADDGLFYQYLAVMLCCFIQGKDQFFPVISLIDTSGGTGVGWFYKNRIRQLVLNRRDDAVHIL